MIDEQRFRSVWDALEDTPQEALNMKLRSGLMIALIERINAKHWNQSEAAEQLGVTRQSISDLYKGEISQFSLDDLVNMLASLEEDVEFFIKITA